MDELKVRAIIAKLQTIAQTRKALMDNVWILENEGEQLRAELDALLQEVK